MISRQSKRGRFENRQDVEASYVAADSLEGTTVLLRGSGQTEGSAHLPGGRRAGRTAVARPKVTPKRTTHKPPLFSASLTRRTPLLRPLLGTTDYALRSVLINTTPSPRTPAPSVQAENFAHARRNEIVRFHTKRNEYRVKIEYICFDQKLLEISWPR